MPVQYKDYYSILGVNRSASADEIRKAYRKLARKYHPDVSKSAGTEDKFKEVSEAYEVIGDPEKRKRYDELGMNWKAGQEFTPPPGWGGQNVHYEFHRGPGGATMEDMGGFSDFFEALFGSMGGQGRTRAGGRGEWGAARGQDHETPINLTLEEAVHGTKKSFRLEAPEVDERGRVKQTVRSINVKIPPGTTDGSRIRLAGQGGAGAGGGPSGDLYLVVQLLPHDVYQVKDHDLVRNLLITPWEAALGCKIPLTTLEGKQLMLTIPAGTSSGAQLRLRGQGLPSRGAQPPGDLSVTIQIAVPRALSSKERQLFEELAKASTFNPR